MRSHYKRIGDYVTQIKLKNTDDSISLLKGININKHFMPSVANINGTDLSKYRVVKKNQFAFNPMHVGRDEVLPISMLEDDELIIVSPAYVVFEVKDEEELLPAYLMMWCRRSEFDRNAWFMTDNSVRGGFSWADFCDMELPVPSIKKQREIVREYNVVNDRISLNEQLTQKLEDTAQAIYKQWFVDFEFPISKEYAESIGKSEIEGKPYKSSGGEMEYCEKLEREVPMSWKPSSLNAVLNIKHGFAFKGENFTDIDNGNILLTPGNVKIGGGVKLDKVRYCGGKIPSDYIFDAGDLMITMTDLSKASDTLGYPALIPKLGSYRLLHNQRLGKVELKDQFRFTEFVYQLLCSTEYRNEIVGGATGTTVKHTSPTKIMDFKFSYCSNHAIYDKFCRIAKPVNNLKETLAVEVIELKRIAQILLTKISNLG
ncbi:restriction endonuclease subunit S [Vibrio splendidus]